MMNLPVLCPFCFLPFNGYGPCPHCGHAAGEPRSGVQQLPLGTILDGKYRLGMVLGQGGFGITYLAYDLKLQTRVAIKEYFPLGLVTRQAQTVTFSSPNAQPFFQKGVEAFYREAQLLTRFRNHPNIVHVSSFFRQNDTAYFVMEYVEGESLTSYLEKCGGRLSYDETVWLLTPVLDALQVVHSAGILHRDIAPDNIYLAKDGNIKLLDFGAAKNELSMHTHSSAAILKPGYAPMEQYSAGSNQGPWTDIYAMGAVIYRCQTGNVPPDAPDRIVGQPLMSFRDAGVEVPAGAEAAISRALALDITDRWQSVTEFKNALIDPSALKNQKIQIIKPEKTKNQKQNFRKPLFIPIMLLMIIILIAAGIISQVILPKERIYREGIVLISDGKYEEGIQRLSEILSYRDTEYQIRRAKSFQAEEYLALDDYEKAVVLFTELSGEEYSLERITQRKEEYKQLHPETPEPTAQMMPTEITPESMRETILIQNELQKRLSTANTGDIITIGRYEQDGNEENGPEDIEWIVLEKARGFLFVVSRYGIKWDAGGYISSGITDSPEGWLNGDFLENSFNLLEKLSIADMALPSISYISTDNEQVTRKIYLLSEEEVEHYFPEKTERIIAATDQADNESNHINNSRWWLRERPYIVDVEKVEMHGKTEYKRKVTEVYCSAVSLYGDIMHLSIECKNKGLIRPAMRINLASEDEKRDDSTNDSEKSQFDNFYWFSSDIQVGNIIQFGSYEQDGNKENGKEPIDWIVLDKQDDKLLLLSKLILDNQSYHGKNEQVTWETCALRNWLNNDFLAVAFTDLEQSLLLETEITTPDFDAGIIEYSDGSVFHNLYLDGSVVTDRCFILSYEEIKSYLEENERNTACSEYSNQKKSEWTTTYDFWYIRSGNCNQKQHYRDYDSDLYFSPVITGDGELGSAISQAPKGFECGVRPAIWINYN